MSTTTASISGNSPLSVLYQVAQDQASVVQQRQISEISTDLQNQLNQKLAALQSPVDQVSINYSQSQINALQAQQKTVTGLETTFGTNASLLADMTSQLNTMSEAVTNSDGTAFDNAYTALNTDLSDLTPAAFNPLFQYDGVAALKTNGFNIQSSASYNLSTPSGQAAATADVTTAQNAVEQALTMTGSNQTVAAGALSVLDGQITALQTLQTQQQNAASAATAAETQRLQTNEQNELHLIQLNLSNSSQAASMVYTAAHPPSQTTSVFGALQNAVGETAKTAETQLNETPAVMSLFA